MVKVRNNSNFYHGGLPKKNSHICVLIFLVDNKGLNWETN